jgi:1,4-dihydroxy-2-naphthoate octaprenyltransferase
VNPNRRRPDNGIVPTATFKTWLMETRPHFLLLTPASVMVGASTAYWQAGELDLLPLFLAFLGGLLAHISVNVLNDVGDFLSGIDLHTDPTPFSGGSGFLVRGEIPLGGAKRLGLLALAGTIPIGAYFLFREGWALLPVGILGVILVLTYTPWITRHPWICLVAPGLGFGPVMVLGVVFCLTGVYGKVALVASLVPGFLVSDLLLLNQFPDLEPDARGGRDHLPVRWGLRGASRFYAALLIAPFAWVFLAVGLSLLPAGALLAALTLPLAGKTALGVLHHYNERGKLIPLMGQNVAVTLLTPVLLSIGIALHRLL